MKPAFSVVRSSVKQNRIVLPFLRWPGGKRWISDKIASALRANLKSRYIEPFLGGGAVFFRLLPTKAILADVNEDLIATFRAVKRSPRSVKAALERCAISQVEYNRVRDSKPRTDVNRAARMIYLNRTAFGGIYRLNQDGKFNVPFGGGDRTTAAILGSTLLEEASSALKSAKLLAGDFERVVAEAGEGDVVYCDPAYTVAHNNNGFIRYNERNFAWADQQRLSGAVHAAKRRGAFVIVSNADHPEIRKLYSRSRIDLVERFSAICPSPGHRRTIGELLIFV
jgi:DNA adenine methylase